MTNQEKKDKEFEDFLAEYTQKLSNGTQSDEEMRSFIERFRRYVDNLEE